MRSLSVRGSGKFGRAGPFAGVLAGEASDMRIAVIAAKRKSMVATCRRRYATMFVMGHCAVLEL